MVVTLVHVWVDSRFVEQFIDETKANHLKSVGEPGNFRFDILQDAGDPCKFVLYEAYHTEEAAAAHKQTQHYLRWRDAVAPWMSRPREGVKHLLLFPA